MIDWVTMKLPCDHEGLICNGTLVKVSKENEVEWASSSFLPVVGSHDATIAIRSVTESTLEISGNPAKWLQGHNLFGINDLKRLVWLFFQKLIQIPELNLKPTEQQLQWVYDGEYTVSRVDINETWHLNNSTEVKTWINAAGLKMRLKHRGAGQFKGDTLYWGKGSKRWFLKCYSKGDEINGKRSNFPDELRTPQMLEYADKALRFEVTLKSNQLRAWELHEVKNWDEETAKMILINLMKGLEMSNNIRLSDEVLNQMPARMKMSYIAWLHGEDLKSLLPKNTFYRYRRELKKYDIDIAIMRDINDKDNGVIPLVRILEAKPVGIPAWAYEQGLVAY